MSASSSKSKRPLTLFDVGVKRRKAIEDTTASVSEVKGRFKLTFSLIEGFKLSSRVRDKFKTVLKLSNFYVMVNSIHFGLICLIRSLDMRGSLSNQIYQQYEKDHVTESMFRTVLLTDKKAVISSVIF